MNASNSCSRSSGAGELPLAQTAEASSDISTFRRETRPERCDETTDVLSLKHLHHPYDERLCRLCVEGKGGKDVESLKPESRCYLKQPQLCSDVTLGESRPQSGQPHVESRWWIG